MNPLQRRIHAWAWIALSALIPMILVLGVASRHAPRPNPDVHWEQFR